MTKESFHNDSCIKNKTFKIIFADSASANVCKPNY